MTGATTKYRQLHIDISQPVPGQASLSSGSSPSRDGRCLVEQVLWASIASAPGFDLWPRRLMTLRSSILWGLAYSQKASNIDGKANELERVPFQDLDALLFSAHIPPSFHYHNLMVERANHRFFKKADFSIKS
jgi:hypothetical protein